MVFSFLQGVPLPTDRVYDGKDMSDVLLKDDGKSKHEVLFMYGGAAADNGGPGAARMGPWKAYWATGPGLGGCNWPTCKKISYPDDSPLMFNVRIDPSEGIPLNPWQGPTPSGNSTGEKRRASRDKDTKTRMAKREKAIRQKHARVLTRVLCASVYSVCQDRLMARLSRPR
jgi:hypothetical protein